MDYAPCTFDSNDYIKSWVVTSRGSSGNTTRYGSENDARRACGMVPVEGGDAVWPVRKVRGPGGEANPANRNTAVEPPGKAADAVEDAAGCLPAPSVPAPAGACPAPAPATSSFEEGGFTFVRQSLILWTCTDLPPPITAVLGRSDDGTWKPHIWSGLAHHYGGVGRMLSPQGAAAEAVLLLHDINVAAPVSVRQEIGSPSRANAPAPIESGLLVHPGSLDGAAGLDALNRTRAVPQLSQDTGNAEAARGRQGLAGSDPATTTAEKLDRLLALLGPRAGTGDTPPLHEITDLLKKVLDRMGDIQRPTRRY